MCEGHECVKRDYESECARLEELNAKLTRELEDMRLYYGKMEAEYHQMKAQLDMVYLIFGGKN